MRKSKSIGIRPEQIIVGAKLRLKKAINNHDKSNPFLNTEPKLRGKVVIVRKVDDPIVDEIPYDVICMSNNEWGYAGISDFDPTYGVIMVKMLK